MTAAPPAPRATVVGLDVLRLCAALLVVSYHIFFFSWVEAAGQGGIRDAVGARIAFPAAAPYTSFGWVGVDLFFVISGFVIVMSSRGKSAAAFGLGRIARLFPALLFFSCLIFGVVAGAGLLPLKAAAAAWARTVVLFPKGPWIDGVIWTLTVEAIFYAAIFISLFAKEGAVATGRYGRIALVALSAFWLAVFLNGALGWHIHRLDTVAGAYWARPALISTGPFFLLGMFTFEVFEGGLGRNGTVCIAAAAAACALIVYRTASASPGVLAFHQSPFVPLAVWAAFTALCAASLVVERRHPPGRRFRFLARKLGLMTYPLYLVHDIPGGYVLGRLYTHGMNRWLAAAATIGLALLVSHLFAALVEPRLRQACGFDRLIRSMGGRTPGTAAALVR